MAEPLRVAIAGLGTVGAATFRLLQDKRAVIAARAGRPVEVVAVSARDRALERGLDLAGVAWADDARALASADVNVVAELIGGSEGVALDLCRAALQSGKSVVTANKAMMAHHGAGLAKLADGAGVALMYEAAIAGGIPIVKSLREGLAANQASEIHGILNGTCNFILTQMRLTGRAFEDVLSEAQELGYAEADPAFDIDGVDAAHKLALLAAIGFEALPNFDAVGIEGIRRVSALDVAFAEELGYRVKLLGVAKRTPDGVEQRVSPCMVPIGAAIAQVEDVFNAVVVEGDAVGQVVHEGRGAGAGPTASAVVADLIDVARGNRLATFGTDASGLAPLEPAPAGTHRGRYYLRLSVTDCPGVLAEVAAALAAHGVSIETLVQKLRDPEQPVPIVMITHETVEAALEAALEDVRGLGVVLERPCSMRIETF